MKNEGELQNKAKNYEFHESQNNKSVFETRNGYCLSSDGTLILMNKFFNKLDVIYTGVFFIFAGLSHFFYTDLLASVVPSIFPMKVLLVHLTGGIEIFLGYMFLFDRYRKIAAIGKTILVSIFLSVHFQMLINFQDYVEAYKLDLISDKPIVFFIARLLIQFLLILWLVRFTFDET